SIVLTSVSHCMYGEIKCLRFFLGWVSSRTIFVILIATCSFNLYLMRMNMAEAIVAMVASSSDDNSTEAGPVKYDTGCPVPNNTNKTPSSDYYNYYEVRIYFIL